MSQRAREISLKFLAGASDMNIFGKVHGGAVMKWIDEAGYVAAVGWCGQYCVTVYVGGIQFHKPVLVGNIVEVRARLVYTGHTSMHILVNVRAGDPKDGRLIDTTHCIIVFVAIDEHGRPIPVPTWQPQSAEDRALEHYARRLMELRKGIEEELADQLKQA